MLAPLVRHGVDFVLVGGQAGTAHGSSYPSYDVDIAYDRARDNVVRLVAALQEIGVRLRGGPPDLPFVVDERTIHNGANFTFVTPYGDFDILGDIDGIRSYSELRTEARMIDLGGLSIRVASLDHLIAMKRGSNRTKDRLMLEEYIVIADEQQRAPDQE